MTLRGSLIVFRKELVDVLRDRRTLTSMIVLPLLLMPLMTVGMAALMKGRMDKIREKPSVVAWLGNPDSPLRRRLAESPLMQVIDLDNDTTVVRMMRERSLDAAVRVPEGMPVTPEMVWSLPAAAGNSVPVMVWMDETRQKSQVAAQRVMGVLEAHRRSLAVEALAHHGLPEVLLSPFEIRRENVASREQMGRFVAATVLPYIIILMALTGAMYPAIDLTAGEKERGTLETLLVSGVSRLDIAFGKFLTVFLASLVSGALAAASMGLSGAGLAGTSERIGEVMEFRLGIDTVVLMLLPMIPLAAIFAGLLITLALFARGYKEAQSYISPLMILVIMPAAASLMPDSESTRVSAVIPVLNVSLVMKEALMGQINPHTLMLTLAVDFAIAGLCLVLVAKMFQRESVLFKI